MAETVWEWPPAVRHAPHLHPAPSLRYILITSSRLVRVQFAVFVFCSLFFLTSPLLFPLIPLEGASRERPEATVLRNDGLGRGCVEAKGGCGALQCSMTDGNMHYFPGGLSQRGPECSIWLAHAERARCTEEGPLF